MTHLAWAVLCFLCVLIIRLRCPSIFPWLLVPVKHPLNQRGFLALTHLFQHDCWVSKEDIFDTNEIFPPQFSLPRWVMPHIHSSLCRSILYLPNFSFVVLDISNWSVQSLKLVILFVFFLSSSSVGFYLLEAQSIGSWDSNGTHDRSAVSSCLSIRIFQKDFYLSDSFLPKEGWWSKPVPNILGDIFIFDLLKNLNERWLTSSNDEESEAEQSEILSSWKTQK